MPSSSRVRISRAVNFAQTSRGEAFRYNLSNRGYTDWRREIETEREREREPNGAATSFLFCCGLPPLVEQAEINSCNSRGFVGINLTGRKVDSFAASKFASTKTGQGETAGRRSDFRFPPSSTYGNSCPVVKHRVELKRAGTWRACKMKASNVALSAFLTAPGGLVSSPCNHKRNRRKLSTIRRGSER